MRFALILAPLAIATSAHAQVQATQTPFGATKADTVQLKNDGFAEGGGQAYLQMGFAENEKAGIWVQVPSTIPAFKIDSFRVLIGSSKDAVTPGPVDGRKTQIFFQMGIGSEPTTSIPVDIENAAEVTPGAYWNDIPAQGDQGPIACAHAGDFIGASLEFPYTGLPSVYRDMDGISNPKLNTLFAVPGGWNYSVAFGLRGDWILRVVGHAAKDGECN
jgi:hypothetical protein